jgi:hypothetical protein
MRTPRLLLVALAVATAALSAHVVRAAEPSDALPQKEQLGVLVDTIRANRKALISVNLALSEDQAAKFWPVYDSYAKALAPTQDRVAALVEEYIRTYRTLSDDKALELIKNYADADAERTKVRRSYIDEFAKILPGRTVARFYQIENKMDAVLRYDLAATIPVVDEKAAAPAK